jgi:hypothetical protein
MSKHQAYASKFFMFSYLSPERFPRALPWAGIFQPVGLEDKITMRKPCPNTRGKVKLLVLPVPKGPKAFSRGVSAANPRPGSYGSESQRDDSKSGMSFHVAKFPNRYRPVGA